jgi:hypothetical protein
LGLGLFGEQARYRLYGEWDKEDEQIPMVLAARQTARVIPFNSFCLINGCFHPLCKKFLSQTFTKLFYLTPNDILASKYIKF